MGKLIVHQEKITDMKVLTALCPFGAMEDKGGKLEISAACKLCKLCVKKGGGAVEFVEDTENPSDKVDKSAWKGIAVYVDHVDRKIHPVTFELIGKAKELASKINQPVYAIFIGSDIKTEAEEVLHYGVDRVFTADNKLLKDFKGLSLFSVGRGLKINS